MGITLPLKLEFSGLGALELLDRGECESVDSTFPVDWVDLEWRVERDCVDRDCVEYGVECVCGDICDDETLPLGRRNWKGYRETMGRPRLDIDPDVRLSEDGTSLSPSSSSSCPSFRPSGAASFRKGAGRIRDPPFRQPLLPRLPLAGPFSARVERLLSRLCTMR